MDPHRRRVAQGQAHRGDGVLHADGRAARADRSLRRRRWRGQPHRARHRRSDGGDDAALPQRRCGREVPGVRPTRTSAPTSRSTCSPSTGCRPTWARSDPMSSRQRLFRMLYRLGFTPWDGHPLSQRLRDLVEGSGQAPALNPGLALDIGCGTGDSSIYLAQHGWQVIGVDYVSKPLAKARAKAEANRVSVEFVEADVTRLSATGIGAGFDLVVDNGCLHGMSGRGPGRLRPGGHRRCGAGSAAPHRRLRARLVIRCARHRARRGRTPLQRSWQLLASGDETAQDHNGRNPARNYSVRAQRSLRLRPS